MQKFIDQVVSDLIDKEVDFYRTVIIVPGKRPILFFKNSFKQQLKTGVIPEFRSIEDFIQEIADVQLIPNIRLWIKAYKIYRDNIENPDDFNEFIQWIPTILNDFGDIDSSLINEGELFNYLVSVERINQWGVNDFSVTQNNQLMKSHLLFWEIAKQLYYLLKKELLDKAIGYNGLIARTAAENIETFLNQSNNNLYVFSGFNALTIAENKIINTIESKGLALTYWQADAHYLNNLDHEAGFFLRTHKKNRPQFNWISNQFEKEKNISVISVSKEVGQAKYVSKLLGNVSNQQLENTALVLGNEGLLLPVLNTLPYSVSANITMGFPIVQLPVNQFFVDLFDLHINRIKLTGGKQFYFKDVFKILKQNYFGIDSLTLELINRLYEEVIDKNKTFLTEIEISQRLGNTIFASLFQINDDVSVFFKQVKIFIEKSNNNYEQHPFTKEAIFRYYELFENLLNEISSSELIMDYKTAKFLFKNISQNESLDFIGEPLEGLQILGVLETRLLDFETVILCNVNEDILPLAGIDNSYIPYDIRKSYKLHTYSEKNAIYAYHFYRLIQHAKNVYLLYDSDTEGLSSGEKSRFIRQLEIETRYNIKYKEVTSSTPAVKLNELILQKSKRDVEILNQWAAKGISASAINTYIKNPIDFYTQKVLNIKSTNEVEEYASNLTLGNIVHSTLEDVYKPALNQKLSGTYLNKALKESIILVEEKFKNEYGNFYLKGRNLIALNVAKTMVKSLIKKDLELVKMNHLVIKSIENVITIPFSTETHQNLKLNGIIDRVDQLNGLTRVIDYKTGNFNDSSIKISSENIEKAFTEGNKSVGLQLLFYSILYFESTQKEEAQFGIYPLRYTNKTFTTMEWNKQQILTKENLKEYKTYFSEIIEDILDYKTPFIEKNID